MESTQSDGIGFTDTDHGLNINYYRDFLKFRKWRCQKLKQPYPKDLYQFINGM